MCKFRERVISREVVLKNSILLLVAAVLVSACGPKLLPLSDVQQLQARDGSYGQDIYGFRRAAGEDVPTMRGNQIVPIRTFTVKTNDFGNEVADQEVADAECLVKAEDAEARIRTPGALHVPVYGYRSPDMTVQCIKPGYQDAVNLINKFNLTQQRKNQAVANAAASGGLIGALVGVAVTAAISAANDPKNDDFNYRAPKLFLRPGEGSEALPAPVDPLPAPEGTETAEAPATATEANLDTEPEPAAEAGEDDGFKWE